MEAVESREVEMLIMLRMVTLVFGGSRAGHEDGEENRGDEGG